MEKYTVWLAIDDIEYGFVKVDIPLKPEVGMILEFGDVAGLVDHCNDPLDEEDAKNLDQHYFKIKEIRLFYTQKKKWQIIAECVQVIIKQ